MARTDNKFPSWLPKQPSPRLVVIRMELRPLVALFTLTVRLNWDARLLLALEWLFDVHHRFTSRVEFAVCDRPFSFDGVGPLKSSNARFSEASFKRPTPVSVVLLKSSATVLPLGSLLGWRVWFR